MKVKEILELTSEELEQKMTNEELNRMQELGLQYTWQLLDLLQDSARQSGQEENEEHITISKYLDYLEDLKNKKILAYSKKYLGGHLLYTSLTNATKSDLYIYNSTNLLNMQASFGSKVKTYYQRRYFYMKKTIFTIIITAIITIILTLLVVINNIQITNIEKGNITITLFNHNFIYYFEK